MINDQTLPSRRHRDVLTRARQRQARIHQPSNEDILKLEQELFAEDEVYIPQLLQAYTEAHGLPEPVAFVTPTVAPRPAPKSIEPLPTPAESLIPREPSEFDRQHNALRLYVFEQFQEGKKAKEIAAMIGLSAYKVTRWYNEVKNQPEIVRLWTPLITESDLRKWQNHSPTPEPGATPAPAPVAPRVVEPSPEALLAAKAALKQAERTVQRQADQAYAQECLAATPDPQLVALALEKEGWSALRIARALELESTTVRRWLEASARAAQPLPKGPLSQLALRSVALLKPFLETAADEDGLCLALATAVERERVLAALSVLDVCPERPRVQGGKILLHLAPEEARLLRHLVSLAG